MAKARASRRDLDSYTIKAINTTINIGDCVLMRPAESSKPSYVAIVEKIEAGARGNVTVHVRWYYRPEETTGGRRKFHGSKELFLSDHYDIQSADTIEGKCIVHSFKSYMKLDAVGTDDFFCRFMYSSSTGAFTPDRVAVYCNCEMPYNPDDLMVQCEGCSDWFHPACIDMTVEAAKQLDHFFCHSCSSEDQKKLQNSHVTSGDSDTKGLFGFLTCASSGLVLHSSAASSPGIASHLASPSSSLHFLRSYWLFSCGGESGNFEGERCCY